MTQPRGSTGMKKMARPNVFTAEAYRSDSRKDSGANSRSSIGCVCAYLQTQLSTGSTESF